MHVKAIPTYVRTIVCIYATLIALTPLSWGEGEGEEKGGGGHVPGL